MSDRHFGLLACCFSHKQENRQRDRRELQAVTLRLRQKNRVKWGEDVVDNEGMGKRKSNKCCIFHKRKKFGESSSESEYSSGAESGSDSPRRRGLEVAAPRNRRDQCTCMPGEGETASGSGATTASRRRPFTRRVQEPAGDDGISSLYAPESTQFLRSPSVSQPFATLSVDDAPQRRADESNDEAENMYPREQVDRS